jgi:phosphohistidine phosphatase
MQSGKRRKYSPTEPHRPIANFRLPTSGFRLYASSMRLYLLRHGTAMEREDWTGDDAERPLTPDGERVTGKMIKNLRSVLRADEILTSPFRRARQTAELVAERLGLPLQEADWLASGAEPEDIVDNLANVGDVILVGHEPDLGELIGFLTGGAAVPVKKAGVAILAGAPSAGGMKLKALLDPKLVSRLRD